MTAGPELTGPEVSGPVVGPPAAAKPSVVDWLLVVFVTLLCGWTALVAVAFLPWHIGPVPMPISALLGVGAMILGPRACYRLTGSMLAAVLPVAAWFVVSVWLVLQRNPMMLTQALTPAAGQWRVMVLLGFGSLAAAATLTLLSAERTRARYAAPASDDADSVGPVGSGGQPSRAAEADEPPARPG